jgi:restriction system protein
MTPTNFEKVVGSLYLSLGWRVFITPGSGDRGIDLVIVKNSQKSAVQCKRYKRVVGEPVVREFYGSFVGIFDSGIFVTSSAFSDVCKKWAAQRKALTLVDGEGLAKLMTMHSPNLVRAFETWKG